MKNIIFIAPPAAGKGTISDILKEKFGYEHISTGDLLRNIVNSNDSVSDEVKNIIAEGKLVDDEFMIKIIHQKLQNIGKPFILDGFPRTIPQAQDLDKILEELNKKCQVIYLNIDEEEIKKRMLGRVICTCGKSYNLNSLEHSPKKEGICDECGQKLIKRDDDNEKSFQERYENFKTNTLPLIEYYKNNNNLILINAKNSTENIIKEILEVIND